MQVEKLVVHNIIKGIQGTVSDLSQALLDVSPQSTQLLSRLNGSYLTKNATYAVFDHNSDAVFPKEFVRYQQNPTDGTFLQFSIDATNALRALIDVLAPAKGGYLVFAHYREMKEFVAVFLLRNTEGMIFQHNDAARRYEINALQHLDLEKLAMACRINLQLFSAPGSGKYLSFIKANLREFSNYFMAWLAAHEREDSTEYTHALYKLSNLLPLPEENGAEVPREELRKRIYTFVQGAGKQVNIRLLSESIYADPAVVRSVADQHNLILDSEFKADPRVMKKFVRVAVAADGIEMRFSRDDLKRIHVSDENPNAVVIESEKFAEAFRREADEEA